MRSCATVFRSIRLGTVTFPHRLTPNLSRSAPPPLPQEQQREFEELQRAAHAYSQADTEAELALHPDARKPIKSDFEGEVNPATGEQGGPKQEPVGKWGEDSDGDWSFRGRVSDF